MKNIAIASLFLLCGIAQAKAPSTAGQASRVQVQAASPAEARLTAIE